MRYDPMHQVFVYGTLKQGFHNHHYLQQSTLIGSGKTTEKYVLYVDRILFVVKDEPVYIIYGQLYSINDVPVQKFNKRY
jgi:gamma-glutamylaminecyclotransferase